MINLKNIPVYFKRPINAIFVLGIAIVLFCLSCTNKFQTKNERVPVISLQQLQKITQGDAPLYIINFWATWCRPCVEEIPYFEKINEQYKDKGVETILVSLDFKEDLKEKVQPFVNKNQLKSKIYLLDVEKQKGWIDEINPNWSGAIPATLFLSKKNTVFKEGELSLEELEEQVEQYYQQAIKN